MGFTQKKGDLNINSNYSCGVRALAVFETLKGVIVLFTGFGLFSLGPQKVQTIAELLVRYLLFGAPGPNCYYEAGFAQALGKPMIFCIHEKYKIHFDLATYRFIVWNSEAVLTRKLKVRLESMKRREMDRRTYNIRLEKNLRLLAALAGLALSA